MFKNRFIAVVSLAALTSSLCNVTAAMAEDSITKKVVVSYANGDKYSGATVGMNFSSNSTSNVSVTTDASGVAMLTLPASVKNGVLFANPAEGDITHGIYTTIGVTNPSDATELDLVLPDAALAINLFQPDGVSPVSRAGIDTGSSNGTGNFYYLLRPGAVGLEITPNGANGQCNSISIYPEASLSSSLEVKYGYKAEVTAAGKVVSLYSDAGKCTKKVAQKDGVYQVKFQQNPNDISFLTKGGLIFDPQSSSPSQVKLSKSSLTYTTLVNSAMQFVIPGIKKGNVITASVAVGSGKALKLPSVNVTTDIGGVIPNIVAMKAGTYVFTFSVGSIKKSVKVIVK